jgi:predicted flavoprotein YhiN
VTHACFQLSTMIDHYPRGTISSKVLRSFFTTDTIMVRRTGCNLKTEEDGRMFPITNTSLTIIDV